jgi:AraC-like DNA-binding protein
MITSSKCRPRKGAGLFPGHDTPYQITSTAFATEPVGVLRALFGVTNSMIGRLFRVATDFEHIVFDSGGVRIGAFRCHPDHPSFQDSGPARNYCFVFPRTAVRIEHEHEPPFVANANVVTFYNSGQTYCRSSISPEGDHCDWFGLDSQLVRDVVRTVDSSVDDQPERPFLRTHGWADSSTYLFQRKLFARVSAQPATDTLWVEENVIELLDRVVRNAYQVAPLMPPAIGSRHKTAAYDIETILSRRNGEDPTLTGIAREIGLSAYHVCRLFHRVTGMKLHQYRLRLRLRAALAEVQDSTRPLTDIALDAGFYSHSHFTAAFGKEFGLTPSALRASRFPGITRTIF